MDREMDSYRDVYMLLQIQSFHPGYGSSQYDQDLAAQKLFLRFINLMSHYKYDMRSALSINEGFSRIPRRVSWNVHGLHKMFCKGYIPPKAAINGINISYDLDYRYFPSFSGREGRYIP